MYNCPLLLVEDEENDIFLFKRVLAKEQITNPLHVAEDGQQAIDYLAGVGQFADRAQFPLPGLVLLDLKLPVKTGLQVLEWIREQPGLETLLVIILTSSSEQSDVDSAYRLGANSFLVKPNGHNELRDLVKVLRAYWLTLNKAPLKCVEATQPYVT
jgi:CheY-like chemotaxis protein